MKLQNEIEREKCHPSESIIMMGRETGKGNAIKREEKAVDLRKEETVLERERKLFLFYFYFLTKTRG